MTVPIADQLEFIDDGNGSTTSFSYPVRFLEKSEVVVAFRENGIDTIKSLNIDYTIAGSVWPTGGAVLFASPPPSGVKVVRFRRTGAKQPVDLENNQRNDAAAVELQLDRLAMAAQDLQAADRPALKLPIGDVAAALPAKEYRAGKILSFDADGQPETAVTKVDVATLAGIAGDISVVSSISADVVAVAANKTNINKVAAIDADVTLVADVADDIPTVVLMRPEIQAVIADKANIGTVASHIANVDKVAAIDTAVTKVAAIDTAVTKVAAIDADVSRVSGIAPAVSAVANDRLIIAAVDANKTNIDAVAANKANINAAVANETNINAVVGNATNINAVAANGTDIDAVAANMLKVNTVAGIAPKVVVVADIAANVTTVAVVAAAVPVVAAIDDDVVAVASNALNITAVANNETNINAVAANETNIDAVKNNATNINAVAANDANIDTVAENITAVSNVSGISGDVTAVSSIEANVSIVAGIAPQVSVAAGINDEIVAVAGNQANITKVADNEANVIVVANSAAKVATVADNIADVIVAADDMAAIKAAPEAAETATTKAGEADQSAQDAQTALVEVQGIFVNMKGGTTGQVLVKSSNSDYAYVWQDATAGGDMFKLNYDPRNIVADAFSMVNMSEGADALILRNTERVKIAASTSNTGTVTSVALGVPLGFAATAAITTSGTITISFTAGYQGFTTVQSNKLTGIQDGAQVNPNMALYQTVAQKAVANGYAGLDGSGKVPTSQLPDSVLGAMIFQNFWNAVTNSPAIPAAAAANKGHYYIVQVAGATNQGGVTDWEVGDWIVSNGTVWGKIDNTDAVNSVAGLKGAIPAAALKTALALNLVNNTADADKPVSIAQATAIGLKANASVSFTGINGLTGGGTAAEDRTIDLSISSKASLLKADGAAQQDAMDTALSSKLDTIAQAADSAKLGDETAAQWQAKIDANSGGRELLSTYVDSGSFTPTSHGLQPDAYVMVELWGGGGGGGWSGSGRQAGGSGGSYNFAIVRVSDISESVPVTVGAGGNRGGATGNAGGSGGSSSFGLFSTAKGGLGGFGQTSPTTAQGGNAVTSLPFSVSNDPYYSSGGGASYAGGDGVAGGGALYGGGGGGSSAGANIGAGGKSEFAGNGGAGSQGGSVPAGGGGGGGLGARGEVRVWRL